MLLARKTPINSLDKIFDDFFKDFDMTDTFFNFPGMRFDSLKMDIYEKDANYVVEAEIPGVDKKDIKLNIDENKLTLTVERKHEEEAKDKKYHRIERSYGKISRSVMLPENTKPEEISAKYDNGILNITIPKKEITKSESSKEITIE